MAEAMEVLGEEILGDMDRQIGLDSIISMIVRQTEH